MYGKLFGINIMLSPNQIKRLILHTQKQLDNLKEHWYSDTDSELEKYYRGFIDGLKLVLEMDPSTISNKPIKENNNDNVRQNGNKPRNAR